MRKQISKFYFLPRPYKQIILQSCLDHKIATEKPSCETIVKKLIKKEKNEEYEYFFCDILKAIEKFDFMEDFIWTCDLPIIPDSAEKIKTVEKIVIKQQYVGLMPLKDWRSLRKNLLMEGIKKEIGKKEKCQSFKEWVDELKGMLDSGDIDDVLGLLDIAMGDE